MNVNDLNLLLKKLLTIQEETSWFEFKTKRMAMDEMGKWVSALANGAFLDGEDYGYLVFGIDAKTKEIKGIGKLQAFFMPNMEKIKTTLLPDLSPQIKFEVHELVREEDQKKVIFIKIPAATEQVRFKDKAYILYIQEREVV